MGLQVSTCLRVLPSLIEAAKHLSDSQIEEIKGAAREFKIKHPGHPVCSVLNEFLMEGEHAHDTY